MSAIFGCCLNPSEDVVPAPPKVLRDDLKTKTRKAMVSKLDKDGLHAEKAGDLDDLIKDRDALCGDLDVDDLIRCNRLSNESVDSIIDSVKAMIASNKKLITHCEKYRWNSNGEFVFQRIELNQVKVESTEEGGNTCRISMSTIPFRSTNDFGAPPEIPTDLMEIIFVKSGFAGLPDYDLFLERALLLNNDVLKPFLHILREHLESIQSYFKEVAAWIEEPNPDRFFLEQTFGVEFEIDMPGRGETKEKSDDSTAASTSPDQSEEDEVPEAFSGMSDSEDERPSLLDGKVSMGSHTNVRRAIIGQGLLLREYTSVGSYSLSFDIGYGQKEKLLKFVEFLEN